MTGAPRGPVRCAVVGVGMMGTEHAEILAASPAADLVVCCDIDEGARARVPPGIRFTASLDETMDTSGLEAVFIATPQRHHLDGIRAAVLRGLAVFCEKPIADSLEAADEIAQLAAAARTPVVFGHMYRFDPRYRAIREAIQAGRLGRLVHLSLRGFTPDFEGRLLAGRTTLAVENAVHGFDLLRWLAGEIERVYAEASTTGVAGDGLQDAIAVTIRFASGAIGSLETDWALPTATGLSSSHHFMVVGSTGVAWIDARDSGVGVLSTKAIPEFPGTLTYRDPVGTPYGLYRTEDEYFLGMVRDGRTWPVSTEDARAALAVSIAVDRSIAEARPVTLAEIG